MSDDNYLDHGQSGESLPTLAVFILNQRKHCIHMNAAAVGLTGYALEEVRGQPLHAAVWHSRSDGLRYLPGKHPIDRVFSLEEPQRGETKIMRKDGRACHVSYTVSPVREAGELVGALVEMDDLVARVRVEQALLESDGEFRQLADAMPQLVWIADAQGVVEYYNARAAEYAGIVQRADGSWTWQPTVHLDDSAPTEAQWARAVATKQPYDIEHRIQMADSSVRWHLSRGVPVTRRGEAVKWFGTATDIHDFKMAHEARHRSDARYRSLFESIDEGFCVVEVLFDDRGRPYDYRFLEVNPAFERHSGLRDVVDKNMRSIAPGLEEYWFEIYGRVASNGEPIRFQNRAAALNDRWFDVYAFRVDAPLKHCVAVLFNDVTDHRRSEQALRTSERRKDEFLAMLSHELRNPLAAVSNAVRLLEPVTRDRNARRYVDILRRQTGMLNGLVEDLLDVSRITRGLVTLKREPVELAVLVDRAVETGQVLLDEKRHEVRVTLPDEPVVVMGDPVRLEQIFTNLIGNAAKYTGFEGRIEIGLERDGDQAVVWVRDNGIGLDPTMLEHIFALFGQAERGFDRSEGGLGIGLTIVKHLVELHGGHVETSSEGLGKGAEFVVMLPLAPPQEQPHAPGVTECAGMAHAKRVLVVDDRTDVAETLALLLEHSGHTVAIAHDGPSALAKAEEFAAEVVFLDIGLPGMDGYEVARRIRKNPRTQHTMLAALTGYGQANDVARTKAAGFDAHFVKPVEIAKLEAFVNDSGRAAQP